MHIFQQHDDVDFVLLNLPCWHPMAPLTIKKYEAFFLFISMQRIIMILLYWLPLWDEFCQLLFSLFDCHLKEIWKKMVLSFYFLSFPLWFSVRTAYTGLRTLMVIVRVHISFIDFSLSNHKKGLSIKQPRMPTQPSCNFGKKILILKAMRIHLERFISIPFFYIFLSFWLSVACLSVAVRDFIVLSRAILFCFRVCHICSHVFNISCIPLYFPKNV